MKLKTVVFFSSQDCNDKNRVLCYNLQKKQIQVFWNPDKNELTDTGYDSILIVTDNALGTRYATNNKIPYIQKWVDNSDSCSFQPVCYYDKMEHLSYEYLLKQWQRAHHLPWTIAETSRILLKELTLDDVAELYEIRSDNKHFPFLPELDSLSAELEKHKRYITYQYEFFDYGLWGIFLKDHTLIGQAGIQNVEYKGQTALELSYLVAPAYQKKGYAKEAILAIYQYVLSSLEINQVISIVAKNNLPSVRTAMSMGMRFAQPVDYLGFDCNYYVMDDIRSFLASYETEQKRARAARTAYRIAQKKPVQQVYSRYHTKRED